MPYYIWVGNLTIGQNYMKGLSNILLVYTPAGTVGIYTNYSVQHLLATIIIAE